MEYRTKDLPVVVVGALLNRCSNRTPFCVDEEERIIIGAEKIRFVWSPRLTFNDTTDIDGDSPSGIDQCCGWCIDRKLSGRKNSDQY